MSEVLYNAKRIEKKDILSECHDMFIVGINNESRSSLILGALKESKKFDINLLIQSNLGFEELFPFVNEFTCFKIIDITNETLVDRIKEYSKIISEHETTIGSIGIDMTGLTIPDLLILLKIIKRSLYSNKIIVYYSEPYNYYYDRYLFGNYEYSLGELNIIEIPGYNGTYDRNKSNVMIFILGFEDKVSRHIYLHDEPDKIVAINGFPASIQKFKDISVVNNGILREVGYDKLYYSDAMNPFELFNTLKRILDDCGDNNYSIVPLGSKPMALGAGIFQLSYNNCKVKYPIAESYIHNKIQNTTDSLWKFEIIL